MTIKRYAMAVRLKEEKKNFYLKNHQIDCFNPFPNNEENNSWVMMDQIFYME